MKSTATTPSTTTATPRAFRFTMNAQQNSAAAPKASVPPRDWVPMMPTTAASAPAAPSNVTNEPVIPDFGEASDCVTDNRLFCPDWVRRTGTPCFSRRSSSTSI